MGICFRLPCGLSLSLYIYDFYKIPQISIWFVYDFYMICLKHTQILQKIVEKNISIGSTRDSTSGSTRGSTRVIWVQGVVQGSWVQG